VVRSRLSAPSASLAALIGDSADLAVQGDPLTSITGIQHDSRAVKAGDLFVALRGGYFDGHDFVEEAVRRGATAVMVERPPHSTIPAIVAPNTRAALPRIAATFFGRPSDAIGVIGVTGTDGKTTTSYLVEAILTAAGKTVGLVGTVSVRIGERVLDHETRQTTPESDEIQRYLRTMVTAGTDWAVLEATSHGLDLHRLDETRFQIGAVTNVTHEHLEHHKTIPAYRRAKGILFERVAAEGGAAIVNLDDEGARAMLSYARGAQVTTYSMHDSEAAVAAVDVVAGPTGSSFILRAAGCELPVKLPLLGRFNVANALCAAGAALAAGVDPAIIANALTVAPSVPGRMERVDVGQPFGVVVDYAHTPESLTKVLELLRAHHAGGKIIAVSGSAGERDTAKRPLQGAVSARLADLSIFTTEDPRFEDADKIIGEIATGAERAGATRERDFRCVTDRREAIRLGLTLAQPGDCVLLAGKGHEQSIIWGLEKRPWDEATVARELLLELGYGGAS
jgi:UDP-N-acetylmuramoyl-L-alanyl-D-glutamate--2,6-diaminopimelate ligase